MVEATGPVEVFEFEGWRLCPSRFELTAPDGAFVAISTTEVKMLAAMARQPGRVFTREWLGQIGTGPDTALQDNAIDSRMSRLRRRLRDAWPDGAHLIHAVRQEGYMFVRRVRRSATA
jgi:two-component system phosphate regulon response regulator OmpR